MKIEVDEKCCECTCVSKKNSITLLENCIYKMANKWGYTQMSWIGRLKQREFIQMSGVVFVQWKKI